MKNIELSLNFLSKNIIKVILFLGIASFPIYIFPPGSIQITHILLLLFSILVLTIIGIPRNKYFYVFLFFLFYNYVVNIFYFYKDFFFITDIALKHYKELMFLTYNFILTISLISYLKTQKMDYIVFYGIIFATLIILSHLFFGFFFGELDYRYHSTFNNPNQLGYFSACCFSLIYLFYRNNFISYYLMFFLMLLFIFISILTLSKAAYFALFLCFLFAIKPFNYKYGKIFWIVFFLTVIALFIIFFSKISELGVYNRTINVFKEQDSSLEVRGYTVYFQASFLQSIFGMGPKNIYTIHGYEVHSTFMMILTSYGIIGFLTFVLLTLFWIFDVKKLYGIYGVICICGPVLLYGLTHNGIRFSIFYILFATSIFMSNKLVQEKI